MKWPTVRQRRAAAVRLAKEAGRALAALLLVVVSAAGGLLEHLVRLCVSS